MDIFKWLEKRKIKVHNRELIQNAFVHSSYANEHRSYKQNNERLEFMGDAVLQVWSAKKLYLMEPILTEGQMTTLRAQLVS
ncbi:MAG: ribonuclease III domain-containing protein, partial [Traorella sp.]